MMNTSTTHYSPEFEVLNAIVLGIALFLLTCLLVWLIYALQTSLTALNGISDHNPLNSVVPVLKWIGMILILGLFWGGCIFILSLLQYFLLVLPTVLFMSRGLLADATRSWTFYITRGALIGGGPWWLLGLFVFDSKVDLGSLLLVTAPGPMIGAYAGAALKLLLVRQLRMAGIENSIK